MVEGLDHDAQPEVGRPEIVAPLADAVRLVDDEQRWFSLPEPLERPFVVELLRRDKQELEVALFQILERLLAVPLSHGEVYLGRPACFLLLDALDLIALQGDQGGDHHGRSGDHKRRDLVDRRLPRTGGGHG